MDLAPEEPPQVPPPLRPNPIGRERRPRTARIALHWRLVVALLGVVPWSLALIVETGLSLSEAMLAGSVLFGILAHSELLSALLERGLDRRAQRRGPGQTDTSSRRGGDRRQSGAVTGPDSPTSLVGRRAHSPPR